MASKELGVMLVVMEIVPVRWRWRSKAQKEEKAIPCHIILACDVYPFIMHLILLVRDGSIIR